MKIYAPTYLKSFHCIADKCRHSCCIGWDIYIDDDTLDVYSSMGGALGEKIRANTAKDEYGTHFIMDKENRCPFLNKCGLCDIILEKGEEYISEICTEHPRYYNFLSDRTEMGLGLCCEEAARIILSQTEKFSLFVLDDDGEKDEISSRDERLLILRKNLFSLLQNRKIPLSERTEHLLSVTGADFPSKSIAEWADVFSGFEIMDPAWKDALSMLSKAETEDAMPEFDTAFENLMIYFIYRHLFAAFDGTDLAARISFAYLGFTVIKALCAAKKSLTGECSFADLCEFARLYSAEIEYSEENTEALIEMLQ